MERSGVEQRTSLPADEVKRPAVIAEELDQMRQVYLDTMVQQGVDLPCSQYAPPVDAARLAGDGYPLCSDCGHPRIVHDRP